MKSYSVFFFGILFILSGQASASITNNPDYVSIAAKYAKLKAKQRAFRSGVTSQTSQALNSLSGDQTGSCDLNVGNVILDDVGNSPDDVVIIIEGDILQSNNCR